MTNIWREDWRLGVERAASWRLFPTERPTVLRFLGAFAQPHRLQRFAALDVVSERDADLPHKSPLILRIPEGF